MWGGGSAGDVQGPKSVVSQVWPNHHALHFPTEFHECPSYGSLCFRSSFFSYTPLVI